MLLGERLSAGKAMELGLLNRVLPADKLTEFSMAWARTLAAGPTLAYALTKRAVNKAIFPDLARIISEIGA